VILLETLAVGTTLRKIGITLIGLVVTIAHAGNAINAPPPRNWVTAAGVGLDRRALDALPRIRGMDRQLLALRAYLRAGDSLPARWSWSREQLNAYPTTAEGRAAAADIDAVVAAFAAANPGYSLRVNRMPRSLEQQLDQWNENVSVGQVALRLRATLESRFPPKSGSPDVAQLRDALVTWKPPVAAPLAAPGLSAHGQGRAFDFEIDRSGQTVAGFDAARARQQWDAAGWTRKLRAAVLASGKPFIGPLESPYEPWHYSYNPAGNGARAAGPPISDVRDTLHPPENDAKLRHIAGESIQ
jgi:hypothetical protein